MMHTTDQTTGPALCPQCGRKAIATDLADLVGDLCRSCALAATDDCGRHILTPTGRPTTDIDVVAAILRRHGAEVVAEGLGGNLRGLTIGDVVVGPWTPDGMPDDPDDLVTVRRDDEEEEDGMMVHARDGAGLLHAIGRKARRGTVAR